MSVYDMSVCDMMMMMMMMMMAEGGITKLCVCVCHISYILCCASCCILYLGGGGGGDNKNPILGYGE